MNPTRVAAVLAVLAVTACGTHGLTTTTTTRSTPSTSASSSPPSTPSAPSAGLWLDAGLPEDGGDFRRGTNGVGLELCGRPVAGPHPVAVRRVSATGPEYGESRELRVFADDRDARSLLADVDAAVARCPLEQASGTTWHNDMRVSALRTSIDAAYTVVRTYTDADGNPLLGATFWEVARVGNAVLLTASGGEYDPTTNLAAGIRHHAGEVAVIAESLCVYAAVPCVHPPAPGTSTLRAVVDAAGFGNVALGVSANEIAAIGGEMTDRTTASGCRVVDLWVNDGPDLSGQLDPDLGLAVIHATRAGPARTDRGVGIGSPWTEVVAAYPLGEGDEVLWSVPAGGYDDRHWRFWFDRDGRLDEFMLLLDDQHCGG